MATLEFYVVTSLLADTVEGVIDPRTTLKIRI
jgi:ABC-type dipeptide/oligopeptide/nickel transport system permease component